MQNVCKYVHQKLVRDPFLILVNSATHPMYGRKEIRYFERKLSKTFQKLT